MLLTTCAWGSRSCRSRPRRSRSRGSQGSPLPRDLPISHQVGSWRYGRAEQNSALFLKSQPLYPETALSRAPDLWLTRKLQALVQTLVQLSSSSTQWSSRMNSTSAVSALCRVLYLSPTQGEHQSVVGGRKLVPGQGVERIWSWCTRQLLEASGSWSWQGILQIFNVVTGSIWPSPDQDQSRVSRLNSIYLQLKI